MADWIEELKRLFSSSPTNGFGIAGAVRLSGG